jgi:hypothetical protein
MEIAATVAGKTTQTVDVAADPAITVTVAVATATSAAVTVTVETFSTVTVIVTAFAAGGIAQLDTPAEVTKTVETGGGAEASCDCVVPAWVTVSTPALGADTVILLVARLVVDAPMTVMVTREPPVAASPAPAVTVRVTTEP